jgi:ABC-type glycerol-3-phosphate transport system permease component
MSAARGRQVGRPWARGWRIGVPSSSTLVKQLFMLAISVAAIYPVYYLVTTSLKSREAWTQDQFGLPLSPTLDNYAAVFQDGRIPVWFINSLIVTGASVLLSTIVSALAAFAIARLRFRGRTFLLRLNIALMVIPPAVLIIPLFLGFQPLGLNDTYQGVVLIYAGMLVPFSVFMLTSFFRTLPVELFEAARIDGATTLRILRSIVIPLSGPGLITLVVVNALWVWNELLIALVFLQNDQRRTLMAGLTLFKGHYSINEPLVMAGTFIAVLPMLLLFLFGQRFFVRGLVAGAVK